MRRHRAAALGQQRDNLALRHLDLARLAQRRPCPVLLDLTAKHNLRLTQGIKAPACVSLLARQLAPLLLERQRRALVLLLNQAQPRHQPGNRRAQTLTFQRQRQHRRGTLLEHRHRHQPLLAQLLRAGQPNGRQALLLLHPVQRQPHGGNLIDDLAAFALGMRGHVQPRPLQIPPRPGELHLELQLLARLRAQLLLLLQQLRIDLHRPHMQRVDPRPRLANLTIDHLELVAKRRRMKFRDDIALANVMLRRHDDMAVAPRMHHEQRAAINDTATVDKAVQRPAAAAAEQPSHHQHNPGLEHPRHRRPVALVALQPDMRRIRRAKQHEPDKGAKDHDPQQGATLDR